MAHFTTYEPATPERFDAERYILANVDLQQAKVDGRRHFEEFGKNEGRLQVAAAILPGSDYRRRKFERFCDVLASDIETGGTFPLATGRRHFSLGDYQAESANVTLPAFIAELEANPAQRYMDLGCGLRDEVYENCLYVEVYPSLSADLIVDAGQPYPIRSGSLDGIACLAVLEHCRRPWEIVAEIHRMLRPGGTVWIDWPFLQPVHGYPSHFFNATQEGMRSIFEDTGFAVQSIETMPQQGPAAAAQWIVGHLLPHLPSEAAQMTLSELAANPWILDMVPAEVKATFACGNTMVATKPQ